MTCGYLLVFVVTIIQFFFSPCTLQTMVSLIGAQFSKPLVANKVTHLICYKFEGTSILLLLMCCCIHPFVEFIMSLFVVFQLEQRFDVSGILLNISMIFDGQYFPFNK